MFFNQRNLFQNRGTLPAFESAWLIKHTPLHCHSMYSILESDRLSIFKASVATTTALKCPISFSTSVLLLSNTHSKIVVKKELQVASVFVSLSRFEQLKHANKKLHITHNSIFYHKTFTFHCCCQSSTLRYDLDGMLNILWGNVKVVQKTKQKSTVIFWGCHIVVVSSLDAIHNTTFSLCKMHPSCRYLDRLILCLHWTAH